MNTSHFLHHTMRRFRKLRDIHRNQGLMGGIWRRFFSPGPVETTESEYVRWITYCNPGMLNAGNVGCFDYAIRNLPSSAPMVEIGSFCGLSTNIIAYFKEKHKSKSTLFTCDKWIFEGAQEQSRLLGDSPLVTHGDYKRFVRESFIRNVQMFSRDGLPCTIEVFSDEFFKLWGDQATVHDVFGRECQLGGEISFCYIDGNHSYEFARRDFDHCDKFLQVGGFILFDDSSDGSGWEVCRVVGEALRTKRFEIVAVNPNYFLRKLGSGTV